MPTDLTVGWMKNWLSIAETTASFSKDPSKKIGCVMVGPTNNLLDIGYNGFPRGFDDSLHLYMDPVYKANHVVHAEMNCFYNAAAKGVSLNGATAYIHGLRPCSKCALAMAAIGIKNVVFKNMYPADPKWNSDWDASKLILDQANIRCYEQP